MLQSLCLYKFIELAKVAICSVVMLLLMACGGSSNSTAPVSSSTSSSASSISSSSEPSESSEASSSSSVPSLSLTCTDPVAGEGVDAITVAGNKLLFDGVEKSIAGPSLFWSNNGWGGEKFYNAEVVTWVKQDWNAELIRAAMGTEGGGDYTQAPEDNIEKVMKVVDAAIANDLYVIIDWHSHHAEEIQSEAEAFFAAMAKCYGEYPNVIYEIYNEPLGGASWANEVKPYAESVIGVIREVDPDNLIIVGSPTWSQDVDVASMDPIEGFGNIAYTLHFYAGTHTQYLRDKAKTALNNGIALFATEWGTVSASGDGAVAIEETQTWMAFLKDNQISHANWALNDKNEGASALQPGASDSGSWSDEDLTESGLLVRDIILNW